MYSDQPPDLQSSQGVVEHWGDLTATWGVWFTIAANALSNYGFNLNRSVS